MAEGGKINVKELRLEEEQQLSNCVYFGLYALSQAHKPTTEFEKIFQKNLFLKPDAAALPHVLHFLFTTFDPEEFRKRFYWPLYSDRESEKTFRNSCMKYIMELNERFKLGMEDITTYVMLFPGGLKFLRIMNKLVKFVIVQELKKMNKLHMLDTMTISLGNRMLDRVAVRKEALNGIFEEKIAFYATEQKKYDAALELYQEKVEMLSAQRGVSKDELLSEEYQMKEIEKTRQQLNELKEQVDFIKNFNSTVESLEAKLENLDKPIISNELIQRTQEACKEIQKHFPEEDFKPNDLMIDNKVNAGFVIKLYNFILPKLMNLLQEECDKRHPLSDMETLDNLVQQIDQISLDVEQITSKIPNNPIPDVDDVENQLINTPGFKFDTVLAVNCENKGRLLFHDDPNVERQWQMSQMRKMMDKSEASTAMKTLKKPGKLQNEALTLLANTQKRSKPKKFINIHSLPAKWTEEMANFSAVSSPGLDVSVQSSKFSIDGHLPLGSSSMIAGNECFKYKFNTTLPAEQVIAADFSPSGRLKSPFASAEKQTNVPKIIIPEMIIEEDNSLVSSMKHDNLSFDDVVAKVEEMNMGESLFNISDGVLKEIDSITP